MSSLCASMHAGWLQQRLRIPAHPEAIHAVCHERMQGGPNGQRGQIIVVGQDGEMLLGLGIIEQADTAAVARCSPPRVVVQLQQRWGHRAARQASVWARAPGCAAHKPHVRRQGTDRSTESSRQGSRAHQHDRGPARQAQQLAQQLLVALALRVAQRQARLVVHAELHNLPSMAAESTRVEAWLPAGHTPGMGLGQQPAGPSMHGTRAVDYC